MSRSRVYRFSGFGKILTITYWRTRLALLWIGQQSLNIQEVVIGEISEEEFAAGADNDLDTTSYILVRGGTALK